MDKDVAKNRSAMQAVAVRRLSGVILALAAVVFAGWSWQTVTAATYQGPTEAPPGGNIPVAIWNRMAASGTQTNAAIDIDGGGPAPTGFVGLSVGTPTLDMGAAAGGQNLFYGIADYTKMNADDLLINLQVQSGSPQTRFSVDKGGNLEAAGRVHGVGCVGKTFVGLTKTGGPAGDGKFTSAWLIANFAPGGYGVVNARCAADYSGSHVCRSEEIMESFACATAGAPILNTTIVPNGTAAFINGGPPGYAALANDCIGWTSSLTNAYARVWFFNTVTGGYGSQTPCSTSAGINFACCQ
jgi:hypothetical protein